LKNLLEIVFTGQVSQVYKAYWTQNINVVDQEQDNIKTLDDLKANENLKNKPIHIDLFTEVSAAFTAYQHTFGTKMLDFNAETSPFKEINNLIPDGMDLIKNTGKDFKLHLFFIIEGERQTIDLVYDEDGRLVSRDQ